MKERRLLLFICSIILSCASLLVFWLPVESGEKVSLSITVMLSYSVLLIVVSDVTPRSGSGQPYLSKYSLYSVICNVFTHVGMSVSRSVLQVSVPMGVSQEPTSSSMFLNGTSCGQNCHVRAYFKDFHPQEGPCKSMRWVYCA